MRDLEINIDIDLWRVPCDLLDINFIAPYERTNSLYKSVIKADGTYEAHFPSRDLNQVVDSIKAKEGCKLQGTLFNHFLQPQLTIGYGGVPAEVFVILTAQVPEFYFNLSHTINEFSIGKKGDCVSTTQNIGLQTGSCSPLDSTKYIETEKPTTRGLYFRHSYFLNVTPPNQR